MKKRNRNPNQCEICDTTTTPYRAERTKELYGKVLCCDHEREAHYTKCLMNR